MGSLGVRALRVSTVLVAVSLAGAGRAFAEEPVPGVTDLTRAQVEAIEVDDIAQGLAVPRGTRIEAAAPPTVRLPVFFETDSSRLLPDAELLLQKLSSAVSRPELAGFRFSIEGHTDDVGTDAYNQGLSERRAAAVEAFLVAQGVSSSKLRAVGRGETSPAVANDGDEGRRRNRRVEVINLGE